MGLYDTVDLAGRKGQVKCWGRKMRNLVIGDYVGVLNQFSEYSVAMREGGFVHVRYGRISGWASRPLSGKPVFDKYGRPFTVETQGELAEVMDDPYFYVSRPRWASNDE